MACSFGHDENSTTYYYVVRSTASGWTSENSEQVSVTTPSVCLV